MVSTWNDGGKCPVAGDGSYVVPVDAFVSDAEWDANRTASLPGATSPSGRGCLRQDWGDVPRQILQDCDGVVQHAAGLPVQPGAVVSRGVVVARFYKRLLDAEGALHGPQCCGSTLVETWPSGAPWRGPLCSVRRG
eukprot:m.338482 g.338482  ORF g.338482 m.338482 type:complete len:136 (+) comp16536_c0_seq7:79-486(+)